MDIDRGLVKALLREGLVEFHEQDISPDMLEASGREAFTFVDAYWRKHGKMPSLQLIEDQTAIVFHDVPYEPVTFWAEEIRKRHLYAAMQEVMAGVMDKLEAADPKSALDRFRDGFFTLERLFQHSAGVERVFDDVDDIMDEYEQSKLGITGIPTPYPALNEVTQGWQPEDLIIVAGRPGLGKTSLALICGIHAWEHGRKVMIISTEMSRRAIRRRCASFMTKTSYGKLKRGKLTTIEEERFASSLQKLKGDERMIMMGKKMKVTLESIEAQAMIHKPDMLIIDGFYLIRSARVNAKMKSDRIGEILDLTKEMAKELGIPVILTTQMNRGNEKSKGKPDLDRLAFSDNMGMIADYVFFLDRNAKMRDEREMRITPVKIREGEFIGSIISTWDFEKCEFHQRRIDDGATKPNDPGAPPPGDDDAPAGSATMPDGRFPDEDDDQRGPW